MITLYQFNGRMFDNGKSWDGLGTNMFVYFHNGQGSTLGLKRHWNYSSHQSFYSTRHARSFKLNLIF